MIANMVASVDGRAALSGSSSGLGGTADRAMFFALRTAVDALLVGTRTLAAEGYDELVRPERRQQREERGLAAEPRLVVLSRSGDVPAAEAVRAGRAVVLRGADAEPTAALRGLRASHGVRSVLCEGGPTLLASLLSAGLVDELFLTVAPMLIGGADPLTVLGGAGFAPDPPLALDLVWVLESEGELLLRYACRPGAG